LNSPLASHKADKKLLGIYPTNTLSQNCQNAPQSTDFNVTFQNFSGGKDPRNSRLHPITPYLHYKTPGLAPWPRKEERVGIIRETARKEAEKFDGSLAREESSLMRRLETPSAVSPSAADDAAAARRRVRARRSIRRPARAVWVAAAGRAV